MSASGKARTGRSGGGRRARSATPASLSVARRQPVTSRPASVTVPPAGLRRPDERLDELVLAVAGDAGDAEDLAGPDLEVDAADDLAAAVVLDAQAVDAEHGVARVRLAAVDGQLDLATDHQLRQVVLVGLGREPLADDPAAPDDRDPIGDLEDLVELVADEDDAVALGREPPQDGEDLLGLLRREHGGRLVEDEDPRLAVERLEDLDPLLPADRQVSTLASGSISKPNGCPSSTIRRCASLRSRKTGLAIVSSPRRMFSATVSTGTSMKCWWTMLMPRSMASDGPRIVDRLAVEQDLALVRHREPVEDVHQGRLAGAVLAEQRVDLAGAEVEVDARRWRGRPGSAW